MKRLTQNLFIIIIIFFCIKTESTGKYFFYEVSTDSSKAYIFGSIHFGKSEWYPFEDYIENTFSVSDALVTEIDINDLTKISPSLLMNRIYSTDTINLKNKLKPENYSKVVSKLSSLGMNEDIIQRIRPWFVAFSIQQLEMKQGNLNTKYGVDTYFTKKAKELNMQTFGIEGIDFQLSLIEKFDCCADEIIESLERDDKSKDDTNELIKAWLEGDDNKINELINQISDAGEEYQFVIYEILYLRNKSMADSIEKLLANRKQYFVVVGAAHLVGQDNIIDYLKKNNRKYKVKRL